MKKIQAVGGGWEVRLMRVDDENSHDPYDGVEINLPHEQGTIRLNQEIVDAIVQLDRDEVGPPKCGHCGDTFTGDNPPYPVVCEKCASWISMNKDNFDKILEETMSSMKALHARMDAAFEGKPDPYDKACMKVSSEIALDYAKDHHKALGPNPPTELPAGKYLVTDPCYVMDDYCGEEMLGAYDRCCNITLGSNRYGMFRLVEDDPKSVVFVFGTAYGDGGYPVYENGCHLGNSSVDSGQIAFIPLAPFEERGEGLVGDAHGVIVTLDKSAVPEEVNRGDYKVGAFEVYTSDDDPHNSSECEHCGETMDDEGRKYRKVSEHDKRFCETCCPYGVCESCDEFLTEEDWQDDHERCADCREDDDEE